MVAVISLALLCVSCVVYDLDELRVRPVTLSKTVPKDAFCVYSLLLKRAQTDFPYTYVAGESMVWNGLWDPTITRGEVYNMYASIGDIWVLFTVTATDSGSLIERRDQKNAQYHWNWNEWMNDLFEKTDYSRCKDIDAKKD
jgi:hypothetical protein